MFSKLSNPNDLFRENPYCFSTDTLERIGVTCRPLFAHRPSFCSVVWRYLLSLSVGAVLLPLCNLIALSTFKRNNLTMCDEVPGTYVELLSDPSL